MRDGACAANAYRYDFELNSYLVVAQGNIVLSSNGVPFFRLNREGEPLPRPFGDRVAPLSSYHEVEEGGLFTGLMDNAGGVAALAVAAPVLAHAGVEALLAFPDEEEGPEGAGNQTMCRGSSRIVDLLPPPTLAIVADVQQGGRRSRCGCSWRRLELDDTRRRRSTVGIFQPRARSVTPPDLYALAQRMSGLIDSFGVRVQESNNAYSSRSDDVSVMLKTPNVLLLGYPGFNRHFDRGLPRAHLDDVLHLAKTLVYSSAIGPLLKDRRRTLIGVRS